MPRSETVEAIVLKTYDVGEADRYCILFTKEKGRLAVRAPGVRKITSRMGGSLLPFRRMQVTLRESSAGWMASSVQAAGESSVGGMRAFAEAAEGIEILLRLTQDTEAMPDLFAATDAFLRACDEDVPHASLAFSLRVLHLLGFLPGEKEMEAFFQLDDAERTFVHAAREGYFLRQSDMQGTSRVTLLRDRFLNDQLTGPLKAPKVSAALR